MSGGYPPIGTILWAKLKQFPHWPAQVVPFDEPSARVRRELENQRRDDEVILVQFFEPKSPYHFVALEDVVGFSEGEEQYTKASTEAAVALAKAVEDFGELAASEWRLEGRGAPKPVVPVSSTSGSKRKGKSIGKKGATGSKRGNVNNAALWHKYKVALGQAIKSGDSANVVAVLDKMINVDPTTQFLMETQLGKIVNLLTTHASSDQQVKDKALEVVGHFKRCVAEDQLAATAQK